MIDQKGILFLIVFVLLFDEIDLSCSYRLDLFDELELEFVLNLFLDLMISYIQTVTFNVDY